MVVGVPWPTSQPSPLPVAPVPSSSFHPHVICTPEAEGRKEQRFLLPLLWFERILPILPSHLLESLPGAQCWLPLPPVFLVVHKVSWLFFQPGPERGGDRRWRGREVGQKLRLFPLPQTLTPEGPMGR